MKEQGVRKVLTSGMWVNTIRNVVGGKMVMKDCGIWFGFSKQ